MLLVPTLQRLKAGDVFKRCCIRLGLVLHNTGIHASGTRYRYSWPPLDHKWENSGFFITDHQKLGIGLVDTVFECLYVLDTFDKVALTSILGTAVGVQGVSGWLLSPGAALPVSDWWFCGAFVFFSFLKVSVDTRGLVGTEWWLGEGWREGGSWAGVESAALEICWSGGRTEHNSV